MLVIQLLVIKYTFSLHDIKENTFLMRYNENLKPAYVFGHTIECIQHVFQHYAILH